MTIEDSPHLASLGWDASWQRAFGDMLESSGMRASESVSPARIVAEHRERYTVATNDGDAPAVLAGRTRHFIESREDLPAVGDWVGISRSSGDGVSTIRCVVPRRSAFVRKSAGGVTEAQVVAANVDVALIATALPGDLSTRRLERYLTLAWESGAIPVVVLTKSDLAEDLEAALAKASVAAPGADVVAVSARTGDGVAGLTRHLVPGRTAVLLGSSGVGKSTLVNSLLGVDRQRTATVDHVGKGKHTTTHRELVPLANGALLIDTPGMRELQLWTADDGLDSAFADLAELAERCRFRDCVHADEPGCAVRSAVESGALAPERLHHWHRLRRELAYLARKQDELASAEEKGRIRSLMRSQRSRLRDKYGDR
jgi:ribosome biogenesis GTPase